jgi:hypothetical protein
LTETRTPIATAITDSSKTPEERGRLAGHPGSSVRCLDELPI